MVNLEKNCLGMKKMNSEKILQLRINWVEGVEYKVDKVEMIEPVSPERRLLNPNTELLNKCWICGHFIIEHWFLSPTEESKENFQKIIKNHNFFSQQGITDTLICGNVCIQSILKGEEKLKAEQMKRKLEKEKQHKRNLKKWKPLIDECNSMKEIPAIKNGSEYNTYNTDKQKIDEIIYKCRVGTMNNAESRDYWLSVLNEIRKKHKLLELPESLRTPISLKRVKKCPN